MSAHSAISADRLKQVLSLDGPEFLGQAYLLLLGRPVDPDGFRNYDAQLRSGASKLSIISELHASQEGRVHGAVLPDLLPLLARTPDAIATNQNMRGRADWVAASIQELLTLEDVAFVDGAYKALLKRAPDAEGFSHYLQLIRSGTSKMRIVSRLRFSAEGRAAAPVLAGLRGTLFRYWLANSSLTGWWYRPIAQFDGDTPLECRVRAVENALMRMVQERDSDSRDLDNSVDDVARLLKALADRRAA